ncbi:DUF2141 domain-containing protein [Brevundimonas goettingensis]|uniref:DUF2141 domain-containing protein n=1 Tax=Brevundimonas goettingensis TaxID=2774190 RepID=A0A975GUX5_9CAUL|nr:DUF2141 domain-containing protein [Brevundimonas goettingensis]QTC90732.1 DUF2141 domain-containing protein [Brevundimonas goettingensis]
MKIILAIATLFVMAPAHAVVAQQAGMVPIAPPPRTANVVPVAPAAGPPSAALTTGRAAESSVAADVSAEPSTTAGPPPVAPSRSIVPPTQSRPSRPRQTTLLLQLETPQTNGRIAVAIYRDADSFRRGENPVRTYMLQRTGTVTQIYVQGLEPGRYAIAAFQDTDGDGKLSKNRLGIPREPFGFSNGARARFGLPAFDAASFEQTTAGVTQHILLRGVF